MDDNIEEKPYFIKLSELPRLPEEETINVPKPLAK